MCLVAPACITVCVAGFVAWQLHAAYQVKLCQQCFGLAVEVIVILFLQRLCARQFHAQRIAMHAIDAEFIVQMRAGGEAGATQVADDVTLLDAATCFLAFPVIGQVRVERAVFRAVLEYDCLAGAALLAAVHDLAVAGCAYRRAARCGIVHALVRADLVEDGVFAFQVEA
mgnify:CR=1 FL=1